MVDGVIENIIYQNADNGYTVCIVMYEGEEISCVGGLAGVHEGEEVEITGSWSTHPVYGKQLKIEKFSKSIANRELMKQKSRTKQNRQTDPCGAPHLNFF